MTARQPSFFPPIAPCQVIPKISLSPTHQFSLLTSALKLLFWATAIICPLDLMSVVTESKKLIISHRANFSVTSCPKSGDHGHPKHFRSQTESITYEFLRRQFFLAKTLVEFWSPCSVSQTWSCQKKSQQVCLTHQFQRKCRATENVESCNKGPMQFPFLLPQIQAKINSFPVWNSVNNNCRADQNTPLNSALNRISSESFVKWEASALPKQTILNRCHRQFCRSRNIQFCYCEISASRNLES